jgi:hypothetical protein
MHGGSNGPPKRCKSAISPRPRRPRLLSTHNSWNRTPSIRRLLSMRKQDGCASRRPIAMRWLNSSGSITTNSGRLRGATKPFVNLADCGLNTTPIAPDDSRRQSVDRATAADNTMKFIQENRETIPFMATPLPPGGEFRASRFGCKYIDLQSKSKICKTNPSPQAACSTQALSDSVCHKGSAGAR